MYKEDIPYASDVGSRETTEKLPGPPFTIYHLLHLEFLFSKVQAVFLPSETEWQSPRLLVWA